jgi:hypothetical protein
VQDNRDKSYLYDNFGVVPAKLQDKGPEPLKSKTPPPPPTPAKPAEGARPAK